MGIALWLQPKPSSDIYRDIDSLITSLRPLFADSVDFEPHLTITSDIKLKTLDRIEEEVGEQLNPELLREVLEKSEPVKREIQLILEETAAAIKSVQEIPITLSKVKFGPRYFKKIYIACEKSPKLISLARICREVFVYRDTDPSNTSTKTAAEKADQWVAEYEPHVSLVYSNIYPVVESIAQTVMSRVSDFLGEDVLPDGSFGGPFDGSRHQWTSGVIKLISCTGPANEWVVLGTKNY